MDNLQEYKTKMPNCEQLYKDLQVSWEVFGDQATIEIAAKMGKFLDSTRFLLCLRNILHKFSNTN